MVADDRGDLAVVVDVPENPLADGRVLLHLSAFFESEGSRLLEETDRQTDLPDVVNKSAEMDELLLVPESSILCAMSDA